mmetsp:Transcript_7967/g.21545  ORF Transcript_7967/g.21545 Transcript_7967/m.21545 type:complete len:102 (-) Transcript_7967:474-779(-)
MGNGVVEPERAWQSRRWAHSNQQDTRHVHVHMVADKWPTRSNEFQATQRKLKIDRDKRQQGAVFQLQHNCNFRMQMQPTFLSVFSFPVPDESSSLGSWAKQ